MNSKDAISGKLFEECCHYHGLSVLQFEVVRCKSFISITIIGDLNYCKVEQNHDFK